MEKIGTPIKRKVSEQQQRYRGGTFRCHPIIFTPVCACVCVRVRVLLLIQLPPVSQRNDLGDFSKGHVIKDSS